MTLQELLVRHAQSPAGSVPEWMLGCFRRHCISFANGETDTTTLVFWLQSRNFTIDLRLPRPAERVPAQPLSQCTAEQRQRLANYEGWAAHSQWNGEQLAWHGETSLQIHNRWPEPAVLRRIGNCMLEFAPSGAYSEDWRLQPTGPGPLVGLHLLTERNLTSGAIIHRGGGLIICGDFAALVRGRPSPVVAEVDTLAEAVAHTADDDELANLLKVETSVARGSLAMDYTVQHSTHATRIGQPLLALRDSDWALIDGEVHQIFTQAGERYERRFSIDTLEAHHDFSPATPMDPVAQTWFAREAKTLSRYTHTLSNVDWFKPLNTHGFNVPTVWQGQHALLLPATPRWASMDLAAIKRSQPALQHLFGPEDSWPPTDLTLAEDRADLTWHAAEFAAGRSFAYHLFNADRTQCLGCLYLYPTASLAHDAEAYLWTSSDLAPAASHAIEQEVMAWVDTGWPFTDIAWPGRLIPFAEWQQFQAPNYYASTRFAEPFTPGQPASGTVPTTVSKTT